MNYSAAHAATIIRLSSLRSKASARISTINWSKARTYAYSTVVTVGVVFYLIFLLFCTAINVGKTAHQLWIEHETGSKIRSAVTTIQSKVPSLASRVVEVKHAYNILAGNIRRVVASAKADYSNIRSEFGME